MQRERGGRRGGGKGGGKREERGLDESRCVMTGEVGPGEVKREVE